MLVIVLLIIPAVQTLHAAEPVSPSVPWIKLKGSSFSGLGTQLQTYTIPAPAAAFDADDDNSRVLVTGSDDLQSGLVTQVYIASGEANLQKWQSSHYPKKSNTSYDAFLKYAQSRKSNVHEINGDINLIGSAGDGIYTVANAVVGTMIDINSPSLVSKFGSNVVLVTSGTVKISVAQFAPARSVAIIADTIIFGSDVELAKGVFVANTISMEQSTKPLKIVGNLMSLQTPVDLTASRKRTESPDKPSVFIVFDPKIYMEVLPYLSTAVYETRQIQ